MMLERSYVQQNTTRKDSFLSPVVFHIDLGTGPTAIYTGKDDRYFLIRAMRVFNNTSGHKALSIYGGGDLWSSQTVPGKSSVALTDIEGLLLDPSFDVTGTSDITGMHVFGWGIRVSGGDTWQL